MTRRRLATTLALGDASLTLWRWKRKLTKAENVCFVAFFLSRQGPTPPRYDACFLPVVVLKILIVNRNTFNAQKSKVLGSIVVSIPACHAGDPGSIPGRGSKYRTYFRLSSVEISISLDSKSSADNVWLSGFA
ncbi:hypothetical protein T02_12431 [Trichinella nativa]|uniref:Uncharacterized protein n=1 Tax=Trichinella nativa TaxID=6335 RepID=A0A0V1L3R7_9BILA|nr:hypothetical protein T02_12431 [Trichinella nativa]